MSRVGYRPIPVPSSVQIDITGNTVTVSGPRGTLSREFRPSMRIFTEGGELKVDRASDDRDDRALHGLTRSLIANMVIGVTEGYEKTLDLVGVGYRVAQSEDGVTLSVMLSHQVEIKPAAGVNLEVQGNNRIRIQGIDKQAVGQVAAEIRAVRPPNVYTGKGIRYSDERVRLKPGKSARRV